MGTHTQRVQVTILLSDVYATLPLLRRLAMLHTSHRGICRRADTHEHAHACMLFNVCLCFTTAQGTHGLSSSGKSDRSRSEVSGLPQPQVRSTPRPPILMYRQVPDTQTSTCGAAQPLLHIRPEATARMAQRRVVTKSHWNVKGESRIDPA